MRPQVEVVHDLVRDIEPVDELEAEHRRDALAWLERTDDIYRRVKPAVPPRHLVSYVAAVDRSDRSSLLVDHILAGLWLPPGGHVDPDEHPAVTAAREAREELDVEPVFAADRPAFVTVTRTRAFGDDPGHTDVSLWYVLAGTRDMPITIDRSEFTAARWWSHDEVHATDSSRFDPHYRRFLTKIDT